MKKFTFVLLLISLLLISCSGFQGEFEAPLKTISAPILTITSDTIGFCTDNICNEYIKVEISSDTPGVSFYYTLNGSTPSPSNGQLYSGSVFISYSLTLKAIAVKDGFSNSAVTTQAYQIQAVSAPTFTTENVLPNGSLSLSLAATPADAEIRYIIDGGNPTCSTGTLYSTPVSVAPNQTITAIGCKGTDWKESPLANFYHSGKTATPAVTFKDPIDACDGSLICYNDITIKITSSTFGAVTHYTTDGSTPDCNSPLIPETRTISTDTTIKAIACKTYLLDSDILTLNYTMVVDDPEINLSDGPTYETAQSTTITVSTTSGANVYYAINGTATCGGTLYTGQTFTLNQDQTKITAIACKAGYATSALQSRTYTLKSSPPLFSVSAGTYNVSQFVSLSTLNPVDAIYYTSDGSAVVLPATCGNAPTGSTLKYNAETFTISTNRTLNAVSCKTGFSNSSVSAAYNIVLNSVATPVITHNTSNQSATITSNTVGSSIYYTTDGSEPVIPATCGTNNGQLYGGAFTLAWPTATTVKAKACKYDNIDSATATSVLPPKAYGVSFSPGPGTYEVMYLTNMSVTLSTATPGATIYYTTNGTAPSCGSGSSGTTVTLTQNNVNVHINAIACKTGYVTSEMSSGDFMKRDTTPPGNPTFSHVTVDSGVPNVIFHFTLPTNADLSSVWIDMYYHVSGVLQEHYVIYDGTPITQGYINMGDWAHDTTLCVLVKTRDLVGNMSSGTEMCHYFL